MSNPAKPEPGRNPKNQAYSLALGMAVLGVSFLIGSFLRPAKSKPTPPAPVPPAATPTPADPAAKLAGMGRLVYQIQCAKCHGPEGHGDGPDAPMLKPPPRDFASTAWRLSPSLASIRRVTSQGIPDTAMTSFAQILSPTELDAVTRHVAGLAPAPSTLLAAKSTAAGLRPVEPAHTAPAFKMTTLDGTSKSLDDYKNKLILITFWAPSCAPCLAKMPALEALARKHQALGLEVLPVSVGEPDASVVAAAISGRLDSLKPLIDLGMGAVRYEVLSTPTTVLIGRDGSLIARAEGGIDWSSTALNDLIEAALALTASDSIPPL